MIDPGTVYCVQQIAEQRAADAEKQQQIDTAVQQNCLDAISQVETQIVRGDLDMSQIIKSNPDLENDLQTRRFLQFVSIATNFASMKFADRLRNIPELIASIKELFIEMSKEIKDSADIDQELQDLIHCFIKLVGNTKRNMELVISPLQGSINHMEVIADVLSLDSAKPLESRDKEDIEIALKGMSSDIEKLLTLAEKSKKESNDLDDKIAIMKGNIQQKRIVIQGRLELSKCAPWLGAASGGFGGFVVAQGAINTTILGGAGALIIGGMAFPPVYAIIAAALIGGVVVGGIVLLVQKLWAKQNRKALNYLNEIFGLLVKLSDANLYFSNYMNKAEVGASKILNETQQIQQSIASGSERYRKINVRICTETIQSTKAMITCIDEIVKVDMTQWVNSSAVLNYASSSNAPSTTKDIKN
jgi:hypothetical protein